MNKDFAKKLVALMKKQQEMLKTVVAALESQGLVKNAQNIEMPKNTVKIDSSGKMVGAPSEGANSPSKDESVQFLSNLQNSKLEVFKNVTLGRVVKDAKLSLATATVTIRGDISLATYKEPVKKAVTLVLQEMGKSGIIVNVVQ
jgi:hypothetical protein